ncbi:hypothetical protein HPP92_004684 [Vanilla planifolia]|uniref:Cysteine protease n=1 Tax=Vanilla planifolia TaxID=51239 RepID=A0A835VE70_VANPL|nr:hypothetical protein HPP92_004684 [Vanilla planifolia]
MHRPDNDLLIREITNHPSASAGAERSFRTFIEKFEKEYGSREEYLLRLGIFARNLARAAEHQLLDPTAMHGITPFSDLTEEEFERTMMGLAEPASPFSVAELPSSLDAKDLPEDFDWREKGAVTDVKMQGPCGSCWAFSTTGAVEGANFVATGNLLRLSEQQLIDCDHTCDAKEKDACDNGCKGGLMTNAYGYLMRVGGLQNDSSYPYTGRQEACKFERAKVAVKVTNFTSIALDEDQIAANLVIRGPLAVGLNAVFMQTYMGGVSCPLICSKRRVNHGVVLVGDG